MNEEQKEVVVELDDVHKAFGDNQVLSGVSLQVYRGETMVVIGQSGTGKSVTLKHIVRLLRPDRGDVYVFGDHVADLSDEELGEVRERVGYLFQGGALLASMSVRDNIALPLREHTDLGPDEIDRRIDEKLEMVGLSGLRNTMPDVLSGGMRKRVALARVIVQNPDIILYDEPTHGLDPIMANRINSLILRLQNKLDTTSIVVTHDIPSALRVGDRFAMLKEGKIKATGTPVEFLESTDPEVRQFVYGEEETVPVPEVEPSA